MSTICEIGRVLANQAQELRSVARLTDDLSSRALEQPSKTLPQQHLVVCDDHAPAAQPAGLAWHPWSMRHLSRLAQRERIR